MDLIHLRATVIDVPLAIHPAKFDAILGAVGHRLGIDATLEQIEAATQPVKAKNNNYSVQNGIAIIPVSGSLMKKTYGLMAASGCSSYETIGAQVQDALKSSAIKGVLLDIDSPGGMTTGLFELADVLYGMRGDKPIYASVNDSAFSAAYAIASCADKIYVTVTGGVGSIGVFCCHVDESQADQKAGTKYTHIFAGSKKVDGNSHQPLSQSALTDTQAEVDREYDMFTTLVAMNRDADIGAITGTEAGCYYGENAIPLLADAVGTFEDALADLITATSSATTPGKKATKLNIRSQALKAEEEPQMAKKTDTLSESTIDELVAQAATEAKDDLEMTKTSDADPEDKKKAANADDEECDEDEEDDEDKKDAKGNKSHATAVRIVNLCTLAGMPTLASTFLVNDFTVEQVEKALLKHRAEKSKTVKIASAVTTTSAVDFATAAKTILKDKTIKDKAAAFRDFLKQDPQAYLQTMLHRDNGEQYTFLKKRGY